MNLTRLRKLIAEGDCSADALRFLLTAKNECEWLDYKIDLSIESDFELCNFARDVIAMKNVGGGFILVGVSDKSWEPIGIKKKLSFDTKELRDKVRRASGLEINVDIVHHEILVHSDYKIFSLIFIRASNKRSKRRSPSVAGIDFLPHEKFGIRRGEIFFRKGDSTVKVTSQADLDIILNELETIESDGEIETQSNWTPFAVEDNTYRLLEKGFEHFVGREVLRKKLRNDALGDPRIWIINVHGPGGVGKSALVNWVTHEFYKDKAFEAILQLTAKETILTDSGIHRYNSRSLYSLENFLDHILGLFSEIPPRDLNEKKSIAIDFLSAFKALIILDNMETVSDGRILEFIQKLPVSNSSKFIVTSRYKTGGWELSVPVNELTEPEVFEFLTIKPDEMGIKFPLDEDISMRITNVTGGLPLAIQWIIGQYKILKDLNTVLERAYSKDAPILEFSFRSIFNILSVDAKTILMVLSIFDNPPTAQELSIACDWALEKVSKCLNELTEVTLVNSFTSQNDGKTVYNALPITLEFAKHQFDETGDFEAQCRRRIQQFNAQIELRDVEISSFENIFSKYNISTSQEKRAAILCRRAESEVGSLNYDNADLLFQQATEMAPNSCYVLATIARSELNRGRIGVAEDYIKEALKRVNSYSGVYCYSIASDIYDSQNKRPEALINLKRALKYDPNNVILRHRYGTTLSRQSRNDEAIQEFSKIIDSEISKELPAKTLVYAFHARIINYKRIKKDDLARKDYETVLNLIKKFPLLAREAGRFSDYNEIR